MESAQIHRGPDHQGVVVERVGEWTVGLGNQRLAIRDRSPAGNMPMESDCGRYVLVYNGELFNAVELGRVLGDHPLVRSTGSDTAVVLAALMRWGTGALARFNGMWSLALLDRQTGRLLLARDRLGIKPFHYRIDEHGLTASSEVKAILAADGARPRLNRASVARFLLQSLSDTDHETIFEGIRSVPPGSYVEIALDRPMPQSLTTTRYWLHPFERGLATRQVSAEELRATFLDAMRRHLTSDVPMAVLLSGGLDSSAILAGARHARPSDELTTLSVLTANARSGEGPFIDAMVRHAGARSERIQVDHSADALFDGLSETGWYLDQPANSLAQVAHRQTFQTAREMGIIVLLSGQGADEQLAGYQKFFYFYMWDLIRRGAVLPAAGMLAGCLRHGTILGEFTWAEAQRYVGAALDRGRRQGHLGPSLAAMAPLPIGLGGSFREREFRDQTQLSLPMLLRSEDRLSMSHSCELRVPFLDNEMVELLAVAAPGDKLRDGWTKALFRRAMAPLLPEPIVWRRRKIGYEIPEMEWARTSLAERYQGLFDAPMIAEELGFIDRTRLRADYAEFRAGRGGATYKQIFNAASLELWLRRMNGSYSA